MKYDLKMTDGVPVRGEAFYGPCGKDAPRVFFLNSVRFGRECVELAGRMGLHSDNVTYDRFWDMNKWGFGDFYDARGGIWDFGVEQRNFEEAMTSEKEYDVLVLPSVNGWAEFTEKTRAAILARVKAGAGLVMVQPFDGEGHEKTAELAELSPLHAKFEEGFTDRGYPSIAFDSLKTARWEAADHYITRGIPVELFPWQELAYYPYEADGEVILRAENGDPVAAVKNVGKGRVAAFGYYRRDILPQHSGFNGHDACFNPIIDTWHGALSPCTFDIMEYFYRLVGRAVLWAAKRDGGPALESYGEENGVLFARASEGDIYAGIEDLYGGTVLARTRMVDGMLPLPSAARSCGTLRVHFSLESQQKKLDFAACVLTGTPAAQADGLSLERDVLTAGDMLRGSVQITGPAQNVEVSLWDGYGRKLACETHLPDESKKVFFAFPVAEVPSIHIFVQIDVYANGMRVHQARSQNVVVTPQKRSLDDFEVFMNPQNRGWGDLLSYLNDLYPEIGMTGNFVGDNRLVAMSGGKGLGVYWYDRAPYTENKEKYLETHDRKYLVRTPCLNDEAFWDENRDAIRKNVGENRKYGPIAYFAQDEGSLTCYTDELDLCFCPNCMRRMREWLKEQYGTMEALNGSWGTAYASWDEPVPMTLLEARRANNYASWGDHRRFMELTYANSYRNFSEMIRAADPAGRVRMSGCQASTAYSGNDYELLHRYVRYFEAYPTGNQYEYHRSFKAPDTILGGWFGYGAQGASVQKRIWHAVYHGLTLISIFWEYACLNPDFTFSQSARSMGEAFREIRREGIGKLLLYAARQETLGVAVHYSMASVHGTTANGRRMDFERNRQGWLDALEDMGYQYRFVSSAQIEAGELEKGVKLLLLPYSIAVGKAEAQAIRAFVQAGGVVVGDFQTGLMDEHCRSYDAGMLDDLFGIRRLTTDAEHFYVCEGFTVNPDFDYFNYELKHIPGKEEEIGPGVCFAEVGTRAQAGTAAYIDGFMNRVAAVVVNEHGAGKGVYLNFSLAEYPRLRKGTDGGAGVRDILRNVIALADIKKPAGLYTADGKPYESGVESFYYSLGENHVVAFQRELDEEVEVNYDGLTVNRENSRPLDVQKVEIRFGGACHIYDIRAKQYLGFGEKAQAGLQEGGTNLYALLNYRALGLTLDVAGTVCAGTEAKLCAELKTEGAVPGQCVFAVNVYRPDGRYAPLYSINAAVQGTRLEHAVPFALNDMPGMWRVEVKDVLTGVSAQAQVELVTEGEM